MGSNMKLASERLMKIADELEKEAADNTFFVCDGCNHTASLLDINAKRKVAGKSHKVIRIASVSVNDTVSCLACGGKMSYVPTDSSEKYYIEAEETEDTGADIFEPVDEQGKDETSDVVIPETDEAPAVDKTVPGTSDTAEISEGDDTAEIPEGDDTEVTDYDGNPDDTSEEPDTNVEDISPDVSSTPGDEEAPAEGDSSPEDEEAPAEGEAEPIIEETVTEDTIEEPMGEGTPDEEAPIDEKGVELPKKEVPKFEKIPKDASEDFMRAVAKYSL